MSEHAAENDAALTVAEAQAAVQRVFELTEWYCADDHNWQGHRRLSERLHEALRIAGHRAIPPAEKCGACGATRDEPEKCGYPGGCPIPPAGLLTDDECGEIVRASLDPARRLGGRGVDVLLVTVERILAARDIPPV